MSDSDHSVIWRSDDGGWPKRPIVDDPSKPVVWIDTHSVPSPPPLDDDHARAPDIYEIREWDRRP